MIKSSKPASKASADQAAPPKISAAKLPFWKPANSKAGVLAYLVLIHALALAGLVMFPVPGMRVFALTVLLTSLGGLGTTVGYHRMLAHRTFKTNKLIERILVFCAIFNGSGHPASWVSYHRLHHSRTDTPEDISSPKHGGFWWAHLRWLYQSAPADARKWAPEFMTREYRTWKFMEAPLVSLSLLCGLALGWEGFFWMGAVRLVYSLHMQCLVNSLSHLGDSREGDCSKNVWWLGPLQLAAWGENWHRNHHSSAGSARFGWHWWQVDVGWYFIRALESAGLASHVRRPNAQRTVSGDVTGHRQISV